MSILKSLWNEFIYGGHFTALNVTFLVITAALIWKITLTLEWVVPIYFGIYGSYLFNRYRELQKDIKTNPERTKYLLRRGNILLYFVLISFLVACLVPIVSNNYFTLEVVIILLFLGAGYSIFFKKISQKVIAFKNIYLSSVFCLIALFPLIHFQLLFLTPNVILILSFIFMRVLVNTSFCDIKDVEVDKKFGVLTIPSVFGLKRTKEILSTLTVISILPILVGVIYGFLPLFSIFLITVIIYSLVYINYDKKRSTLYLLADGEGIIWLAATLLGIFIMR